MSTSANPAFASLSPAVQVNLHVSLKIAQTMGMIVPPLYLVACLARHRPLTVRGLMKTSTNSTVIGGIVGYGIGAGYLRNEPEEKLVDRVVRLVSRIGTRWSPDHSTLSALFESRARERVCLTRRVTLSSCRRPLLTR